MQKLLVLLAVVLFAGYSFSQHTDIVNQTGSGNTSNVDQGFMPSPGPGLPGNEAYVDQIGNSNVSDVDQFNNGFAGAEHWAKVWSQGGSNYVKVFQENHGGDADVYQLGGGNWTSVIEIGNFNSSTAYTPGIDAHAYSIGNDNVIVETIWGTDATAYAHQIGSNNRIDQLMGSGYGEKVENSDFEAFQQGNGNIAYQLMDGQGFAGGITAVNNFGTIYTVGNNNYAAQIMNEDVVLGPAANNYSNAYQSGDSNWSGQYQAGDGNSSTHTQLGNGNVSLTNQN